MKIRKNYLIAIIFVLLSVVSLFSIIPQERLPLEDDGKISWTLAGVQGGIPDPVDDLRIIDVTYFNLKNSILRHSYG